MTKLKFLSVDNKKILHENRIDDAKRLAQELGVELSFNYIVGISSKINPNHKYLFWIVKNFDDIVKNSEDAIELLTYFDQHNSKFTKRDINQYTNLNELEKEHLKVSNQKRREISVVDGTGVLYDDDAFIVLIPETKSSSCYYGAGTVWCTANSESHYYQQYRSQGELYYIISRTKSTSDNTYKMAVRMVFDNGSGNFPPIPGIAEIRDSKNNLLSETVLTNNSSSNVLTAIHEDFNRKWDAWWNEMAEELKKRKEEESEKTARERIRRAEQQRIENQREAARRLARRNEREARREGGEYEGNEEVYALRYYLISIDDWYVGNPEETERLTNEIERINQQIELMEARLEEFPENEEMAEQLTELRDQLDELEDNLSDVAGNDIYDLHLEGYHHYGLNVYTNEHDGKVWTIGTDEEADEAAKENIKSFIEEFRNEPGMGFREGYIEHFVDGDQVAREFEDDIENMVRESPDSYLDDDDKTLTEEGESLLSEKKDELVAANNKQDEIISKIDDIETEMLDLDPESDEYTELDDQLTDLKSELDDIETEISDLESEIEDIEDGDDYKDYSETAIQEVIDRRLDEIRDDPVRELREYGITDLSNYIDEDELIESVISDDGRGNSLSSYDGDENKIQYNGTWYFIYRIN